ncbi:MucBP domain-containing protein [Weissella kandleri]|uniref:MucBP domain-containing protein n=1 Tax=Weissella kandleri TaxID=1616 RepID=UPI00387E56C9
MKFSKYLLLSTTVLGLANPLIALASDKTNQVKNTEQSAQTKASNKNDNKKVSEITNNNLKKATTNKLPIDYGQTNNLSTRVDNSDLDVSTGWNVTEFISDYHSDVNEIFVQGYADTILNQKYASIQVGGEGDTVFTAKKVLKLQKGHTYNFDIIYAQAQSTSGNSGKASGYIDFNGDRIESTDDGSNKHYTKTIAPSADMDFIITVHLETFYPDNIYWKVGYDLDKGGVVDDTVGADVTAKYVDTAGNKIAEDVVKSGTLGEDYSTDQLDIPGYTFKEVQGNPTGKFTDTAQTVTYVYTKDPVKAADVTAKYVDTDGNKIAEDVVKSGNVGDDYSTDQLKIKGYTFKEVQGNPTGKFTDTAQTVTYVYTKDPVKAADVTAKYVDTAGNKIAEDVVNSGNVGDDYSTDQIKIKGYTFKEVLGNPTG